jgi:hypothetical protein
VFVQWLWSYINYRRGARLITEHEWRLAPQAAQAALPPGRTTTADSSV